MTTFMGTEITVTSVQLRMIADKLNVGEPDALTDVFALPRTYLTLRTLAAPPHDMAVQLRTIAAWLERLDTGRAFVRRRR